MNVGQIMEIKNQHWHTTVILHLWMLNKWAYVWRQTAYLHSLKESPRRCLIDINLPVWPKLISFVMRHPASEYDALRRTPICITSDHHEETSNSNEGVFYKRTV